MIYGRQWLGMVLAGMAACGCGQPPRVVTMGPPGSKPDVLPQIAKDHTATSVGETGVAPAARVDPAQELPVLEATEPGVERVLESGLKYATLKAGQPNGEVAKAGRRVEVHYVGRLADGEVFDSSRQRNATYPFTMGTGAVIKGWEFGLSGMKVGELRRLVIPPALAYGEKGNSGIPPNATLTFEVELLKVN